MEWSTRAPRGRHIRVWYPRIFCRVVGTHYKARKNKIKESECSDDPVQEREHCWQDHNTRFRCVLEFSEQDMFACLIYVDPREESNSPEHTGDNMGSVAQPNATARMPQETLMNKLPNARLRTRCASHRRGNDSQRQQKGAGAWTTQCPGQSDGNGTVTKD